MNEDFDDLASLFMSDIFHGHPAETQHVPEPSVKRETHESGPGFENLIRTSTSADDFNDFLNSNSFINNSSEVPNPPQSGQPGSFGHTHYSGLNVHGFPSNIATYGTQVGHLMQHMPVLFNQSPSGQPQQQLMGQQEQGQMQQMQQMQQMYDFQQHQMRQASHLMGAPGGSAMAGSGASSDQEAMFSTLSFENSPVPEQRNKAARNNDNGDGAKQKSAKAKSTLPAGSISSMSSRGQSTNGSRPESRTGAPLGKKESLGRPYLEPRIQIRYKQKRLTRLLDLKDSSPVQNYTISDKNGSNVSVNFSCFLTGKLLTNDFDNSIFLLMAENADPTKKHDAKIISCYRRNLLQIAMNLKLTGFSSDEKLLRLQNNEYGYNVSRVIKWFKIQVLAVPSSDPSHSVPVLIRVPKDKDGPSPKGDIAPIPINEPEHIVTLNNSEVKNGIIDNYYSVKQLQFRKATPYNGKLTLQNYFQLKVRLKAIVADLYYDDYVDDFSATSQNTDRNEVLLHEVTSEPIIVRGRNPSFYEERNDLLLGNRNPDSRASFEALRAYVDESDDDETEEDSNVAPPGATAIATEETGGADHEEREEDDGEDGDIIEEGEEEEEIENQENDDNENSREVSVPNKNSPDLKTLSIDKGRYKYFPISSIYYLPPISSVYFPHSAHQKTGNVRSEEPTDHEKAPKRRSSSNVYFR
ncbi:hypothetical protein JA9_002141 [Meyerozyma sp. JA9]|nr:hypothetical protein JA9_002141 [Meyerozyma sp. JA9]